ncbi:hypothetical protein [Micromonospora aurantiaca (nom. illeg.)]|uniref:hypothetical protein n=1 Tax=Micromonospora aurantiaca (nom. illeg.) TaxID=47850 RepID=UPI00380757BD
MGTLGSWWCGCTCEFAWEREWRVPHDLRFGENDVAILFAPEEDHNWMCQTAWGRLAPSAFRGPVLDPRWNIERVQRELADSDRIGPG